MKHIFFLNKSMPLLSLSVLPAQPYKAVSGFKDSFSGKAL
jgi:hypothetical protein